MNRQKRMDVFTRQFDKLTKYERRFTARVNELYDVDIVVRGATANMVKTANFYSKDYQFIMGDIVDFDDRRWLVMGVGLDVANGGYDVADAQVCPGEIYLMDERPGSAGTIYSIPYTIGSRFTGNTSYINNTIAVQDARGDISIPATWQGTDLLTILGATPSQFYVEGIKYQLAHIATPNNLLWTLTLDNVAKDGVYDDMVIGVNQRWKYDTENKQYYQIRNIDSIEINNINEQVQIEPQLYVADITTSDPVWFYVSDLTPSDFIYRVGNTSVLSIDEHGLATPLRMGHTDIQVLYLDEQGIPYVVTTARAKMQIVDKVVREIIIDPSTINFENFNETKFLNIKTIATDGSIIRDTYTLSTSDPSIVTVNYDSVSYSVTSQDINGAASVTATSRFDPTYSAQVVIYVDAPDVWTYKVFGSYTDGSGYKELPDRIWGPTTQGRAIISVISFLNGNEQVPEYWNITGNAYTSILTRLGPNSASAGKQGSQYPVLTFSDNNTPATRPTIRVTLQIN